MTLREEILHSIDDVPESSLQLLLQFVRFLRECPVVTAKKEKKKRDRPRLLGVLEGKVWMSDDFNDPMDFVSPEEAKGEHDHRCCSDGRRYPCSCCN